MHMVAEFLLFLLKDIEIKPLNIEQALPNSPKVSNDTNVV